MLQYLPLLGTSARHRASLARIWIPGYQHIQPPDAQKTRKISLKVGTPIPAEGVVRLTKHELADHDRSRHSRCELTPFRECSSAVLLENVAGVEVAVVVEVIVDRGMGSGKFLESLHVPALSE